MNTTLLAAVVGVLTGVISSFIAHYFQVRLERQKLLLQNQSNSRKDFKLEIARTVQTIMAMVHEVSWASWEVAKGRAKDKDDYLAQYNQRAKENLNVISEKLALIAATNIAIYERIREIAQNVYSLDLELANELVAFAEGRVDKGVFETIKAKANAIEKGLPKEFADILSSVDRINV